MVVRGGVVYCRWVGYLVLAYYVGFAVNSAATHLSDVREAMAARNWCIGVCELEAGMSLRR